MRRLESTRPLARILCSAKSKSFILNPLELFTTAALSFQAGLGQSTEGARLANTLHRLTPSRRNPVDSLDVSVAHRIEVDRTSAQRLYPENYSISNRMALR